MHLPKPERHRLIESVVSRKRVGTQFELLDALAERPQLWKPLPRDLAAWWRQRDAGDPAADLSYGIIRKEGDGPFASLEPPV